MVTEFTKSLRAEIGQFMGLPITPKILHRVEFRSVGRQKLHPERTVLLAHKIPDPPTSMTPQAIPDNQQLAAKVTHKMSEKMHHLSTANRPRIQPKVEMVPGHPRHRRKRLPVKMILQHGCLPSWRPSPTSMRPLAQSTLVNEHYRAALPMGFFLSSAQRRFL